MASGHPHGYEYDLFVSYSTRDLGWVRQFHDDLVEDVNRFVRFDVFPFLDKARLQPGYVWHEKLPLPARKLPDGATKPGLDANFQADQSRGDREADGPSSELLIC